jgi:hypothetical protein
MMGVSFPAEDVEEANRRQIGAVKAENARKAKRTAPEYLREFDVYDRMLQLPWVGDEADLARFEWLSEDFDGS